MLGQSRDINAKPEPPLVSIGGSAGSLRGLLQFFEVFPQECGIAFIVVVHLSPSEESLLPQLVQRRCALTVSSAQNNQKIKANHVYVIPPGRILGVCEDRLKLTSMEPQGRRVKLIDTLFESVASSRFRRTVAILLSGADSDGSAGIQHIKRAGGAVLAQEPAEAAQQIMPGAAIASGCTDAVLRVAEMPAWLLSHFSQLPQPAYLS